MASIHVSALCSLFFLAPAASAQCLTWDHGFGPPPAGQGFADNYTPKVLALHVHDDGGGPALYAGGRFISAGPTVVQNIARWDGSHWSPVGSPSDQLPLGAIHTLASFDEGAGARLFAGGQIWIQSINTRYIARWDGLAWSPLGSDPLLPLIGTPTVADLLVHDDGGGADLYVAGCFYVQNGQGLSFLVSRWDGTQFSPLGAQLGFLASYVPVMHALASFDSGSGPRLYAGGRVFGIDGADAHGIVSWDGSHWSIVGGGVDGRIAALTVFDDGSGPALYAGGEFQTAGSVAALNVARWNGSSWSAVGAGLPGVAGFEPGVRSLAVFDDGGGPALYAAGRLEGGVLKWDGHAWTALMGGFGDPQPPHQIDGAFDCLASFDDGSGASLFAGGGFTSIGALPAAALGEWHGCSGSQVSFCAGDGGEVACPCNNDGLLGHGCDNSAATGGALLLAGGGTSPDTLVLGAFGEVGTSTTVFLQGDQSLGFVPFGAGLRCIGGHLRRLFVVSAHAGAVSVPGPGGPSISARSAALGDPLTTGAVRFYQAQYRDPAAGLCVSGATFNATNAVRVVW